MGPQGLKVPQSIPECCPYTFCRFFTLSCACGLRQGDRGMPGLPGLDGERVSSL